MCNTLSIASIQCHTTSRGHADVTAFQYTAGMLYAIRLAAGATWRKLVPGTLIRWLLYLRRNEHLVTKKWSRNALPSRIRLNPGDIHDKGGHSAHLSGRGRLPGVGLRWSLFSHQNHEGH